MMIFQRMGEYETLKERRFSAPLKRPPGLFPLPAVITIVFVIVITIVFVIVITIVFMIKIIIVFMINVTTVFVIIIITCKLLVR